MEATRVRIRYALALIKSGVQLLQFARCRGPNEASFVGNQLGTVNATGLTKGKYVFQLIAWDAAEASNNDTVTVTVLQSMLSSIRSSDSFGSTLIDFLK